MKVKKINLKCNRAFQIQKKNKKNSGVYGQAFEKEKKPMFQVRVQKRKI